MKIRVIFDRLEINWYMLYILEGKNVTLSKRKRVKTKIVKNFISFSFLHIRYNYKMAALEI